MCTFVLWGVEDTTHESGRERQKERETHRGRAVDLVADL